MADHHFSSSRVLVVGASGLDIIGRMETLPQEGVSTPARIRRSYGGVARNVAENLARLGQPVTLLTAVGADGAGEGLLEYTASAGVDVSSALRTPDHTTGTYLALISADGLLYHAIDDMRVINALEPEIIQQHADLFKTAGMVFVDANLSPAALRTTITLANEAQVPVCADPTSLLLASKLCPHLPHLLMVTPNRGEAAILCQNQCRIEDPQTGLQAAHNLVAQGVEIVILQIGEHGVCYATAETSGHIPAIQTTVNDPTGAGDALTATVIFALLNNIPLDDAVRLGVTAASLTLRHLGTVMSDLSLEKLYDELVI